MSSLVEYNASTNIFQRFRYHVVLGLKKEIGDRTNCPKNVLEKIGDVGLWTVEVIPEKIKNFLIDPRVVAVALTALALVAASFLFYPVTTWLTIKMAISLLPLPPLWAVR